MAVAVIDRLEMIQIEAVDRNVAPIALAADDLGEAFGQRQPVGQSGEAVAARECGEGAPHRDAGGGIMEATDHALDAAGQQDDQHTAGDPIVDAGRREGDGDRRHDREQDRADTDPGAIGDSGRHARGIADEQGGDGDQRRRQADHEGTRPEQAQHRCKAEIDHGELALHPACIGHRQRLVAGAPAQQQHHADPRERGDPAEQAQDGKGGIVRLAHHQQGDGGESAGHDDRRRQRPEQAPDELDIGPVGNGNVWPPHLDVPLRASGTCVRLRNSAGNHGEICVRVITGGGAAQCTRLVMARRLSAAAWERRSGVTQTASPSRAARQTKPWMQLFGP